MSKTLQSAIRKAVDNIEPRRIIGILRTTPGALGEPESFLPLVEEQNKFVTRTEVVQMVEREVARHSGNIQKADPATMQRKVEKWIENQTLLRETQNRD
jgi:hypothetical protein